ncbi:flagellar biosynthesis protein FlhB [Campylobacter helveticus]|uniref:Flagellar biosynthetic protein FlhB n=1 Tax=Campylobacter helveticus TaxID=28898 RepID=A0AAX2UI56_9BACT|nr:flagellar biosynthesis protein FlhB [Campylobacter helveticus]ARE80231.1 flagellar export apparatus, flagellar biosynthetic protein FlhB [Campylobacter helveticus]MCR2054355.1 flagellar biosynthesis protein FlhB [Campylobacter helveticus]MCR2056675.1 flagellar biosynthesis protein FlhB [Campylobacter helveticus]MCR2059878.1 flagellar biosynthesis protein FlhB [Campylobacter helveticus]MCR2061651.1 flagellar biosynthesis protein FlhB [Campylobacter helveticus]
MAGEDQEKTEEPTSKKIEDARQEGNVPKSQDASAVVTLIVAITLILFLMGFMGERIANLYRYYQSFIGVEFDLRIIQAIMMKSIFEVLIILAPIVLSIMVAGVVGNIMQFGFIFTTKPIMPNLSKINPLKGLKNLFSLKKLIESVKIILKVSVVFTIAFIVLLQFVKELPKVELYNLTAQMIWLRDKALILAAIVIIAFIVIAVLDVFLVRFQYFQGLRMSKQEIKDEYKQMEGDPQVKGRIRRLQMEAARRRMVQDVAGADVVITNPTHYAVALRYDTTKENAPRVVAKGVDFLALRIKEMAYKHNVIVYENPPLARQLYRDCDIDQMIPRELFKAVSEVFKFVYQANKKKFPKS